MATTKAKYMGIKRLAANYMMTIPAARKALMLGHVMDGNGQPMKPGYAKSTLLDDGTLWHQWDVNIANKVFRKAGYKKADEVDSLGHAKNRDQAQSQIEQCLTAIGNFARLEKHKDLECARIQKAVEIYSSAMVGDCHAIGGPCAVQMINSKASCAAFVTKLHFVFADYVAVCKELSQSEVAKRKIDKYYQSLRRISNWVQSQYFR